MVSKFLDYWNFPALEATLGVTRVTTARGGNEGRPKNEGDPACCEEGRNSAGMWFAS